MQNERFIRRLETYLDRIPKNPYIVLEKVTEELKELEFYVKPSGRPYLKSVYGRLEQISKIRGEELERALKEFLEDVILQLYIQRWDLLEKKWQEELFRERFLKACVDEMKALELSYVEMEYYLAKIIRAYKNVIVQEPIGLHEKPNITKKDWLEKIQDVPQNKKEMAQLLSTGIFMRIPYRGLPKEYSDPVFEENLKQEIQRVLQ